MATPPLPPPSFVSPKKTLQRTGDVEGSPPLAETEAEARRTGHSSQSDYGSVPRHAATPSIAAADFGHVELARATRPLDYEVSAKKPSLPAKVIQAEKSHAEAKTRLEGLERKWALAKEKVRQLKDGAEWHEKLAAGMFGAGELGKAKDAAFDLSHLVQEAEKDVRGTEEAYRTALEAFMLESVPESRRGREQLSALENAVDAALGARVAVEEAISATRTAKLHEGLDFNSSDPNMAAMSFASNGVARSRSETYTRQMSRLKDALEEVQKLGGAVPESGGSVALSRNHDWMSLAIELGVLDAVPGAADFLSIQSFMRLSKNLDELEGSQVRLERLSDALNEVNLGARDRWDRQLDSFRSQFDASAVSVS